MSEEDFLTRWSRRKRKIAETEKSAPPAVKTEVAPEGGPVPATPAVDPQADFDPAILPPIDSINALSDITGFLRQGVPAELTRAALRRVWTADPSIRDFVGLAENAWDFTDPTAMPGFGPLEATEDVQRMIAQIVDQIGHAAKPSVADAPADQIEIAENSNYSNAIIAEGDAPRPSDAIAATDEVKQSDAAELGNQVLLHSNKECAASQHDLSEAQEKPKQLPRRGHGGALPE
ncbi:MAG: DUF3306 domain-containing protein [Alphaproteobacteria bacterium]